MYGLYVRKSTEEDERQAQSIEDQVSVGNEYARKNSLRIGEVFSESRSAKEEGRPEFQRMLAMIDSGKLEGVIAWHPDRLSRNEMDAAQVTMRLRKGILKNLHFVNYYFQNSPEGLMMLQIALSQSQYYSSKLTHDVKRGMESKVKKGWFPHRAPAGYLNDTYKEKGQKTISPDPDRFPLIRKAFDTFLTGAYPATQVLDKLNNEWGYRSPKRKKIGGKKMSLNSIYNVLSNVFYAGYFVENGVIHEGKHEPMITLEEYRRVQTLLGRPHKIKPKKHEFPYTGLIYCGACGSLITGQVTTNRHNSQYTYYRCPQCKGHIISEKHLTEKIDAVVNDIAMVEVDFYQWGLAVLERWRSENREVEHTIYKNKLTQLSSIDQQLDRLLDALTAGLIESDEYQSKKAQLKADRLRLREETMENEQRADQAREAVENKLEFIRNVRPWLELGSTEMKRVCVRALGSNFLLIGKEVTLEPHPLLLDMNEKRRELETEYREIKLDETLSESIKKERIEAIINAWSCILEHNQTLAYEHNLYFPKMPIFLAKEIPSTLRG
jgi:site-specific DNA recombinase